MKDAVAEIIEEHRAQGRLFEAEGLRSFALDSGSGECVVCVHGVPSSSFLYRKVVPLLAEGGLRAVAFDFPGLGLAERPEKFDYSWSGLARWMAAALRALGVERCHLVVHDIGGPIGLEWALANRDRVASLTILNTMFDVASFHRPWSMRPFATRGVGELWLKSLNRFSMRQVLYMQAIAERSAVSKDELSAYYDLLVREDGGRGFLKIMRGFELTEEKERLFREGAADQPWPVQIVWGERDPALTIVQRHFAQRIFAVEKPVLLPAKHFPQEDRAPAVARAIAELAR
ncbi:MAG: alpha/beta fold hydrolase [Solirubrobacterales bacterium]